MTNPKKQQQQLDGRYEGKVNTCNFPSGWRKWKRRLRVLFYYYFFIFVLCDGMHCIAQPDNTYSSGLKCRTEKKKS